MRKYQVTVNFHNHLKFFVERGRNIIKSNKALRSIIRINSGMSRVVSIKIGSMAEYRETQNAVGRMGTCSEVIYADLKEGGELSGRKITTPSLIYLFFSFFNCN